MQIIFSKEEISSIVTELKEQLLPDLMREIRLLSELPPLLTRKQFMELTGIGESKCAELFNREDFPVTREFGHPRVPTKLLFDWIYENTDWVQRSSDFQYPRVI